MKTILLVDDEIDILDVIGYNLRQEGYDVLTAANGKDALNQDFSKIDLIILDVMLPGMNGFDICRKLKAETLTAEIPIIFLTAKNTDIDEVIGLEIGAEDYIVKPVSLNILMARIRTIFRRDSGKQSENKKLIVEEMEIDLDNYAATINNTIVPFTKKEFETLVYLIQNKGRIISRDTLLEKIWGDDVVVGARTIDVHIRKIREKLGSKDYLIETLKGIGYRFKKS
ncbi:MAG: response regulator transcription factor [Ignavibacteria bacterium]|nr:response regulator transcription factor [Ignavibacteria bacterium]